MGAELNYKNKYMALRAKYMADADMFFRLGFEQGQQQAQNDQAMQAEQQQQEMEQAQAQAMAGGQPGGQPGDPSQGAPEQEMAQPGQAMPGANPGGGSELDQHISKLEQMIAKTESLNGDSEIKKSLEALKSMRKAELQRIELKKSEEAIKGIAKALHKPRFKIGVQASHNLSSNAKQAVSMQHKIVNDMMAKMEEEEKRASKSVQELLNIEGLTKKE